MKLTVQLTKHHHIILSYDRNDDTVWLNGDGPFNLSKVSEMLCDEFRDASYRDPMASAEAVIRLLRTASK